MPLSALQSKKIYFYIVVNFRRLLLLLLSNILTKGLSPKETPLVTEVVNFETELLVFENTILNCADSVSDIIFKT